MTWGVWHGQGTTILSEEPGIPRPSLADPWLMPPTPTVATSSPCAGGAEGCGAWEGRSPGFPQAGG